MILCSGCEEKKGIARVPEYINELYALGYSKEEVERLEEKLSDTSLDLITEYDYVEILLEIIEDDFFNIENLEKYLKYYEPRMVASAVVYIVNHDIQYTYNEKLVNLMNHQYFITENLDRYMKVESEDIDTIIRTVNTNIDREFYTEIKETDISKETLLIANKYYQLPKDYFYGQLVTIGNAYSNNKGQKLNKTAYEAFKKMVDAAEKEDVHFRNLSAYRSYQTQNGLYNNYKKEHGEVWADKWSARPGHSEHQTGLALDVAVKGNSYFDGFEKTKEFAWLQENAHLYGFILRYPEDKQEITGYGYEPWHYRYVGEEVATYIHEENITFEEYYAYFIERNGS